MAIVGGLPSRDTLGRLEHQLNALVAVLAVADVGDHVETMFRVLADTAVSAEPLLAEADPTVLVEIGSALRHARHGRGDDARADLLMASRRLALCRRQHPPRDLPRVRETPGLPRHAADAPDLPWHD